MLTSDFLQIYIKVSLASQSTQLVDSPGPGALWLPKETHPQAPCTPADLWWKGPSMARSCPWGKADMQELAGPLVWYWGHTQWCPWLLSRRGEDLDTLSVVRTSQISLLLGLEGKWRVANTLKRVGKVLVSRSQREQASREVDVFQSSIISVPCCLVFFFQQTGT